MKKRLPLIMICLLGFLLFGPLGAALFGVLYWAITENKRTKSTAKK